MDIKMVVCDLDNTLLKDDKSISNYTIDILHKCQKKGIKFAIATARNKPWIKNIENIITPDVIISDGGCMAWAASKWAANQLVYSQLLDFEDIQALLQTLLSKNSKMYISAESTTHHYVSHKKNNDKHTRAVAAGKIVETANFAEPLGTLIYKITAKINLQDAKDVADSLENIDATPFSNQKWVRFAHANATKYKALQAAASYIGINMKHIAAFGDDVNDIEIIDKCGVGVCVENGVDQAKAVASHICPSNEKDGVAKWIEQNLF